MSHVDAFIGALTAAGMRHVENRRVDGHAFTFAIFADVPIECGPHRGRTIECMAIPIPDDVMLPPPGIHTRTSLKPQFQGWGRGCHLPTRTVR